VLQDSQERAGGGLDDVVDVTSDEQQNDEEDGSSDGTDTHAGNHNLGALHGGVGDFLNHVGDAILDPCQVCCQLAYRGRRNLRIQSHQDHLAVAV
jgi:hypothetical protein